MAGMYVNTWGKRCYIARTQVVTVTDGNGLQRNYIMGNTVYVEPGDVILLTDEEIATLHEGSFEPAPPL